MRFLCIFLPPVAVYKCGKPGQAVLNFFLTLALWLPGVIHAWLVVSAHKEQERTDLTTERQRQAKLEAAWDAEHTSDEPPAPPPGWVVPPVEEEPFAPPEPSPDPPQPSSPPPPV